MSATQTETIAHVIRPESFGPVNARVAARVLDGAGDSLATVIQPKARAWWPETTEAAFQTWVHELADRDYPGHARIDFYDPHFGG